MDRKSVIVLVICGLLFLFWAKYLVPRYAPPPTPSQRTNQVLTSASSNLPPAESSNVATNTPATSTANSARPAAPEELLVEENDKARYTFSSYGGGLKVVELKNYREVISCRDKNAPGTSRLASLNTFAEKPILNLTIEGLQGDGVFKISKIDHGVRAEKLLPNGMALVKEFRPSSNYLVDVSVRMENRSPQPLLLPRHDWTIGSATPINPQDNGQLLGVTWYHGSAENVEATYFGSSGGGGCRPGCSAGSSHTEYHAFASNLVWAAARNQFFALAVMTPTNEPASDLYVHPIALPPAHCETNDPPAASAVTTNLWFFEDVDFKDASGFVSRLKGGQDRLSAYLFSRLSEETKRLLAAYGGGTVPPALLTGLIDDLNKVLPSVNLYQENRDYFGSLTLRPAVRRLDQNPPAEERARLNRVLLEDAYPRELHPSPTGCEITVSYGSTSIPANQSINRAFTIYAGPKEYKTINLVGLQFNNSLDEVMWTSAMFFGVFFAKLLLVGMNALYAVGLPYASAIIAITVIIKLLFWPLTQASTRSMKRMQALQPEIKAIQAKYKDDPMKVQKRTMELFKEHKVSPLGGCLPMLLQLPVFVGFYTMIRSAIELRGAQFLWVCDLSQPDTLFIIPGLGFLPFVGVPGVGMPINPLPLVMGVTMLWQARLTPPSPGMDPSQQKIMKYMPLMFLLFLYNFSAGLTLYWTVQNLLTIAQTKLTRAKEEKAGSGPSSPPGPPQKKKK